MLVHYLKKINQKKKENQKNKEMQINTNIFKVPANTDIKYVVLNIW
jgi:hypothetical protein